MFHKRPVFPLWLGMTGLLLSACVPLPSNGQVAPPTDDQFPKTAQETSDLFSDDDAVKDVGTTTTFKPTLEFAIDALAPRALPGVSLSIYQTKSELEIGYTETMIEHAGFRFDKLTPGLKIGGGKFELGTPPKLTLDVTVTVTSSDYLHTALLAVKASNPLASVYVADIRVKAADGGLIITSIGNATRANDKDDTHTTAVSARLTQTIEPGYVILPDAGTMRTRTAITSEPDPKTGVAGVKVFRQPYTIQ